jgi:hypothetical protein
VSASRRFHLWLPSDLEAGLRTYGRQLGLGLGPAIRLTVRRGLDLESQRPSTPAEESSAALAALTAAEHAVLMVASVLPEGERRMHALAERAAQAAEERLAMFRRPSAEEERP